ncbi:hypothetical protein RUM44_004714 [Polyplax serrata]|uniref:Uncharacterized protein n=1 Tax=Polyplax serrata TaxID=468196 RepID=A0ABR1B3L2_POLSC
MKPAIRCNGLEEEEEGTVAVKGLFSRITRYMFWCSREGKGRERKEDILKVPTVPDNSLWRPSAVLYSSPVSRTLLWLPGQNQQNITGEEEEEEEVSSSTVHGLLHRTITPPRLKCHQSIFF